jgi:diadenosine tetraphosphate (Ap4A) HIT family hydrolase
MTNLKCEFCTELSLPGDSRFRAIYGAHLETRIHEIDSQFVLFPTLGQILPNWFLLAPKRHVETFSSLTASEQGLLDEILRGVQAKLFANGKFVMFEHGCGGSTGNGCGIYHAHIHLVPVDRPVLAENIMSQPGRTHKSLIQCLDVLRNSSNYYLLRDTNGTVTSWNFEEEASHEPISQFFRMRMADLCGVPESWNWKDYESVEPRLLEAARELAL